MMFTLIRRRSSKQNKRTNAPRHLEKKTWGDTDHIHNILILETIDKMTGGKFCPKLSFGSTY